MSDDSSLSYLVDSCKTPETWVLNRFLSDQRRYCFARTSGRGEDEPRIRP